MGVIARGTRPRRSARARSVAISSASRRRIEQGNEMAGGFLGEEPLPGLGELRLLFLRPGLLDDSTVFGDGAGCVAALFQRPGVSDPSDEARRVQLDHLAIVVDRLREEALRRLRPAGPRRNLLRDQIRLVAEPDLLARLPVRAGENGDRQLRRVGRVRHGVEPREPQVDVRVLRVGRQLLLEVGHEPGHGDVLDVRPHVNRARRGRCRDERRGRGEQCLATGLQGHRRPPLCSVDGHNIRSAARGHVRRGNPLSF